MKLHLILAMAGLVAATARMDHLLQYRRTKDPLRQLIAKWLLALIPAITYITVVKLTSKHEYTEGYFLLHRLTMNQYMNALRAQYWIDGLTVVTAVFFAGIAKEVITPIVEPDWDMDKKVSRISMKMQTIRFLLYFGMVVLVSNVVQLRAFLDIASQFVPAASEKGSIDGVQNLINSLVTSRGVLDSVLLAGIVFPAAFFLREEAFDFAREALPDAPQGKREEWLRERSLIASTAEVIPRLGAVLAPLLAGPLSTLLQDLK